VPYILNTFDDFFPNRGRVTVSCSHPRINDREITVGQLHNGRFRISLAVPDDAELGSFEVMASLEGWLKHSGGIGSKLQWVSKLFIQEEKDPKPTGSGSTNGTASHGNLVAIVWKRADENEWTKSTVGDVEVVAASDLAAELADYAHLTRLGDLPIPTIMLNLDYAPLKAYLGMGAKNVVDETIQRRRDRYAVGVGVGLCIVHKDQEKREKQGETLPDEAIALAKEALARGVLSNMPEFDELAKEAGVDE
jgi:hypothetical protein